MTIERLGNRWGDDLYGCCDKCSADENTHTDNFGEAARVLTSKGWRVTKEKGEWVHYCPTCADPDFPKLA